jgi:hypothetical protein
MTGTVQILTGLTMEDYIAFPDEAQCKSGAPTTHEYTVDETQAAASPEVAQ